MNKKISILMNCYNSEKFIQESILSVINQTYKNWELIIFDNLSTDNTANIVNSITDTRIKYIKSSKHYYLGLARYKAEKYLNGEFIGILDSDDIWMPNKLEKQINDFDDPDVSISYTNTIFFSENNSYILYKNKQPSGYIYNNLLFKYNISLETILIRKEHVDTLDCFFDPQFKLISDFDIVLRLSKNFKIKYRNEILAKWRKHENNTTNKNLINFLIEKEKWASTRILNKNLYNKFIKKNSVDKALLFAINEDFNSAKNLLSDNLYFNIKYFFTLYICFIPFMRKILITLYSKRLSV